MVSPPPDPQITSSPDVPLRTLSLLSPTRVQTNEMSTSRVYVTDAPGARSPAAQVRLLAVAFQSQLAGTSGTPSAPHRAPSGILMVIDADRTRLAPVFVATMRRSKSSPSPTESMAVVELNATASCSVEILGAPRTVTFSVELAERVVESQTFRSPVQPVGSPLSVTVYAMVATPEKPLAGVNVIDWLDTDAVPWCGVATMTLSCASGVSRSAMTVDMLTSTGV